MPETLRVKARVLVALSPGDQREAKRTLDQSMEISRGMNTRAWELRAAIDLAALLLAEGRSAEAKGVLQPVFAQFTEGRETADLQRAERLLAAGGVESSL